MTAVATEVSVRPNHRATFGSPPAILLGRTRFVITPEGVCRGELCFPLPKNRKAEFVLKESMTTWFNLSLFARLIKQPVVPKSKEQRLVFWRSSSGTDGYLESFAAPNFTLPDLNGKLHSLADFRGKKYLLVTWLPGGCRFDLPGWQVSIKN